MPGKKSINKMVLSVLALCMALGFTAATVRAQESDGYLDLLSKNDKGLYSKHGWNHYGPGSFTLDRKSGVLTSHNGMGLFWYSARQFKDFVLELDFMCDAKETNSGIFFRIPNMPASNDYIFECFEIQIYDADLHKKDHVMHAGAAKMDPSMLHTTGAVYDAKAPDKKASLGPGKWNHYKITCKGLNVVVELNGEKVNDWMLKPMGKVATCWPKGYIGLQNHDATSSVHFRNLRIKEL
ncbi:MAG: DUF1080 domain-containing protein [Gemmatimonadota bacterium]|nr:DUF1080 domain-containing protein [Gemmatimonadota bacterium]